MHRLRNDDQPAGVLTMQHVSILSLNRQDAKKRKKKGLSAGNIQVPSWRP
jgi:hypothetical protein